MSEGCEGDGWEGMRVGREGGLSEWVGRERRLLRERSLLSEGGLWGRFIREAC